MSRNYIAIDFGDGTTCAAAFIMGENNTPQPLELSNGVTEIPTVIGFVEKIPYIGTEALIQCKDIYSNWKESPTYKVDIPPYTYEMRCRLTVAYMHEVLKKLKSNNPGEVHSNTQFVIGVPSGWTKEDIEMYKAFAIKAGFPTDIIVIKESQAACLYARKFLKTDKGNKISDSEIANGVLTIDVGSSTTDFTYIRGLSMDNYGIALGAKEIEKQFFLYAYKQTYKEDLDESSLSDDQSGRIKKTIIKNFRALKEYLFTNNVEKKPFEIERIQWKRSPTERLEFLTIADDKESVDTKTIEKFVGDATQNSGEITFSIPTVPEHGALCWRGHFRKVLRAIEKKWGLENKKDLTIVITGGATRMYFIDNDIKSVLGEDASYYFGSGALRSFSVVFGLAWAGYIEDTFIQENASLDSKIQGMSKPIDKFIDENILKPMAQRVAKNFVEDIMIMINEKMFNTMNGLFSAESDLLSSILNAEFENLGKKQDAELQKSLKISEIESMFSKLYKNFGRPNIQYKAKFHVPFDARYINSSAGILNHYLDGAILSGPESYDAPFVEPGFFANGTRALLRENLTARYKSGIIEKHIFENIFHESMPDVNDSSIIYPSDFSVIRAVLVDEIIRYKRAELNALCGHEHKETQI